MIKQDFLSLLDERKYGIIQQSWEMLSPFLNLVPTKQQQQRSMTKIHEAVDALRVYIDRELLKILMY